jgi:hypothetical protein
MDEDLCSYKQAESIIKIFQTRQETENSDKK